MYGKRDNTLACSSLLRNALSSTESATFSSNASNSELNMAVANRDNEEEVNIKMQTTQINHNFDTSSQHGDSDVMIPYQKRVV